MSQPTGTPRIVAGIVLLVVSGLLVLRGLIVTAASLLLGGDPAFLAGSVLGVLLVGLLLAVAVRNLLLKGLAQRRAYRQGEQAARPLA